MTDPRVIWLRDQILERIRVAKAVRTVGGAWHAQDPDKDGPAEVDDDLDRFAAAARDGGTANHIAMNDPPTVVAICLAELDILAEHRSSGAVASSARAGEHCVVCDTDCPCRTVRRLHDGYRRRKPW